MEIKKNEIKNEVACEKSSCYKHHHIIMPFVIAVLFVGMFMAGLAVGHEFGEDGDKRGEKCQASNEYRRQQINFKEKNDLKAVPNNDFVPVVPMENATSTTEDLNATSTPN